MKKLLFPLLTLIAVVSCTSQKEIKIYNQGINIIPAPVQLTVTDSTYFLLNNSTVVVASNDCWTTTINYLTDKVKASTGYNLKTASEIPADNFISLKIDQNIDNVGEEGYTLESTASGINITAKTDAGIFYGIQTLLQLLPAEIESQTVVKNIEWSIPSVSIIDYPRFGYRGHMMDICRHFRPTDLIKKQLDVLCAYKINRLHWHLTDDQGWRIEIKKYPKLTELGSVRTEGDGQQYGPYFYTQEEIKDIVKYAAERHIEVIPEIEMPGHGMAALTAYPEFSCTGGPFKQPRIIWGVEDDVYCVGNDATFSFLEDIIKEVVDLFPSKYIHIGGDECPKIRWKECPKCQARAKELGLKATSKHTVEERLQSYFVTRMEKIINSYGKSIIGWDEILEGGLAPSATVMSWRGIEGGIAAASQDHDVIMTPGSGGLYIDHYQGATEVEPVTIGGYSPLKRTYSYDPIPEELAPEMQHHILGAQCNMWTEYIIEDSLWEYMMYPRSIALAELTWTPKENKNFESFCKRLNNAMVRMDCHNINYHIPIPEGILTQNIAFLEDSIEAEFNNTRDYPMVYTLDGTEPTCNSTIYVGPLKIGGEGTIKIATLLQSGKLSKVRTIPYAHVEPSPVVNNAQFEVKNQTASTTGIAKLSIAKGLYPKESDWANASFDTEMVVDKFNGTDLWDMNEPSLGIYEGYFTADTTGVYTFTTDMDELWIDGQRIILNEKLSRHYANKVQVALTAGKHYYKFLFNNMIKDGWPNNWNSIGFNYQKPGDKGAKSWQQAEKTGVLSYKL